MTAVPATLVVDLAVNSMLDSCTTLLVKTLLCLTRAVLQNSQEDPGLNPFVSTYLYMMITDTKLTKCLENVGHDFSIRTLLNQAYNLLLLSHLIEVEVDNVGDNLREKSCSGYHRC